MPASRCAGESLVLMWSAVLRSSDSRAPLTLWTPVSSWQTWKKLLMFWPASLPFVHPELCARVQRVLHYRSGLWMKPAVKNTYCTALPPSSVLCLICRRFDLYLLPFVVREEEKPCLSRNKRDLTPATHHLQYYDDSLWLFFWEGMRGRATILI